MLPDILTVAYRADLHLLTVRWLADPPRPADVQAYYQQVLDEAHHHPAPRWLIDVRRRPIPDPFLAQWFAEVWLPQAAALVAPRQLRLAYLLSPLRLQATFEGDPALAPANARILAEGQPYVVETFLDEGAAMRWLLAA